MVFVRRSAYLMLLLCGLAPAVSSSSVFADAGIYVTGITPSSAYPHALVHLQGGGASPQGTVTATLSGPINQTILIGNTSLPWSYLGSNNLTLASTFADQSGNWSIDFLTPPVYPGDYSVGVIDNNSMASDLMDFHVLMNVTVVSGINATYWPFTNTTGTIRFLTYGTATPSSGFPGTFLTVSGTNPSTGQITVYFDNTQVATVIGSPSQYWSASFQVPNVSPGNYTIRAFNANAGWMSITSFYVTSSSVTILAIPLLVLFSLFALALVSGLSMFLLLVAAFKKQRQRRKRDTYDVPCIT